MFFQKLIGAPYQQYFSCTIMFYDLMTLHYNGRITLTGIP